MLRALSGWVAAAAAALWGLGYPAMTQAAPWSCSRVMARLWPGPIRLWPLLRPLRRRVSKAASAKRCLYLENGHRVRGSAVSTTQRETNSSGSQAIAVTILGRCDSRVEQRRLSRWWEVP